MTSNNGQQHANKTNRKPINPTRSYVHRPLLSIPGSEPSTGPKISIMTYNTLAQALVNRKRFPTSGNSLRWASRSKVLFEEIADYSPDIICLQEVDLATWDSEWKPKLQNLGFQAIFHSSRQKKHGVAIAFNAKKFACLSHMFVDYDSEMTEGMSRSKITDNVAIIVYLSFKENYLDASAPISKKGLIVGTTHLYWHAFASYERTRQTYILLKSIKQFTSNTRTLFGSDLTFYTFLAGDFNSQPFDAAYLSITEKPVDYHGITKNGLGRSIVYDWLGTPDPEDNNPDPEHFDFSSDTSEQISKIRSLHNNVDLRAISLYSVGYGLVHPENSGLDNNKNEPLFSNWTNSWKGLIDYICAVSDWSGSNNRSVDTVDELANTSSMKLLKLLKMPAKEEMCSESLGLPQPGMYASDHLCMMAELELL